MKLNNFDTGGAAKQAIDNAMQAVHNSCALILDFTELDGGDINTAEHLLSYFFPSEQSFGRLANDNASDYLALMSQPTLESERVKADMPVVLLTSPFMQASGEFFAYQLKQRPQTTLIGRATMGVSTWLESFNLPLGLQIDMPVAHYQDPNGNNWQHIGVTPDIDIALEASLTEAKRMTAQWCVKINSW
ncbi:S41 family peptidase [Thalassotalea euphylliae]|uniref:S41 family peptidase n=1 Tax=Thalassotalea euphylliae TaxID=1655234 RepID=UPI002161768A|nr:S41 family peptidase [Thalassotalea euphylliae]